MMTAQPVEVPDVVVHTPAVEMLADLPLTLGECPTWDDRRRLLWFVDIHAPAILAYDPKREEIEIHDMPQSVGSLALTSDDRLIVAMRHGVHLYDPKSGRLDFLVNPGPELPQNRLNDGKAGPDGRFWVGSMDDSPAKQPTGALYRIEADGSYERVLDGIVVSNGLAWSRDGGTLYHADTRNPVIRAFAFDKQTGVLSGERALIRLDATAGLPDGAAVDNDDFYWSAGMSASSLNRISKDGRLVKKFILPVLAPSMPCFGGDDFGTLYVTTLSMTRDGRTEQGALLRLQAPVKGLPSDRVLL